MMNKKYYVYMMTNRTNNVIYTGVTNDLVRRVYEHKNNLVEGFTKQYQVHKLVYFEQFDRAYDAISREKQLKGGSRRKKLDLIEATNRNWQDLELG
jgi:putative endonuclease